MTEARDAMASARIGWKLQDRVGFGSVLGGGMARYCSKRRGREPLGCFRIAGEGKGRWKDRGKSGAGIHLQIVLGNRRSQLLRGRDGAWNLQR